MNVEEFEKFLTPHELTNFKAAVKQDSLNVGTYLQIVDRIDNEEPDLRGCFVWAGTPQGHEYWENISNRINTQTKIMCVDELMGYFTAKEWAALCKKAFDKHGHESYSTLMGGSFDTLGNFIMSMLKIDKWRGVPIQYVHIMSRKRSIKTKRSEFHQVKEKKSIPALTTRIHQGL